MADVYAIFGTLLALGIAFPGMLTAWWLLFPRTVEGAQQRLSGNRVGNPPGDRKQDQQRQAARHQQESGP